ncbi:cytochrome b [Cognatiluteimonas weifangensis]|uniref:Cytochrome b n=1 Tax=Cognatiluteimonas weifangensis TaxID=2303539 RepID=A0A372DPC2_9GAMM|nr:cytochrome b [Luteimonas weifangensis]RFP61396.1 cytochrome b [Luteimonas weifangensis]
MSVSVLPRYRPGLRRLHWLTAVLVAVAYVLIEQRNLFPRGSGERAAMMQGHYWTGLAIWLLLWWRLALRAGGATPPITPPLPGWQAGLSRLLHLALYAFLLAMPLLGLATAWTDDKPLYLPFTDFALPALLAPDKDLAHRLEDLHGSIGEAFYWVIGLHIVAALYHHWWRRDDTLRRML